MSDSYADGLEAHVETFQKLRPFFRISWSPGDTWYWRPNLKDGSSLGPLSCSCRIPTFEDYLKRFVRGDLV